MDVGVSVNEQALVLRNNPNASIELARTPLLSDIIDKQHRVTAQVLRSVSQWSVGGSEDWYENSVHQVCES